MPLPWPVAKELLTLKERLNRLFDESQYGSDLGAGEPSSGPFCPPTDLYETEDELVAVIELPGVDADSIDLQLHGDRLRVAGEIGLPESAGDARFVRMERPRGAFYRDFRLPRRELLSEPQAELENGVLTVRLAFGPRSRKVTIGEDE